MKHSRPVRTLVVLTAQLVATMAFAQSAGLSEGSNARAVREDRMIFKAFGAAKRAREALRLRDFIAVGRLAAQSIALTDEIAMGNLEAHEVLAEAYLLQNKLGLALAEIGNPTQLRKGRLGMTRALILLAAGRREEARAQILFQIGTASEPTPLRETNELWEVPLDNDRSDAALEGTARLVRASYWWREKAPETLEDLQAAFKLKPNSGLILVRLASERWSQKAELDQARAEIVRAQASANLKVRHLAGLMLPNIDREIAERDRAKTSGQEKSGSTAPR